MQLRSTQPITFMSLKFGGGRGRTQFLVVFIYISCPKRVSPYLQTLCPGL